MDEYLPLETDFLKYSHPIRKRLTKTENDIKCSENTANNCTDSLQYVLDSMFEIKRKESEDYIYESHVSTVPTTRLDVLSLKERLNSALETNNARETGICPLRRQLYDQCFDELIRQVTIECVDRGLLLYSIRNEIKMSFMSLDYIRESAIAFGLRTALKHNSIDIESQQIAIKLKEENEKMKNELKKVRKELIDLKEDKNIIIKDLEAFNEQEIQRLNSVINQQRSLIDSLKRKPIDF